MDPDCFSILTSGQISELRICSFYGSGSQDKLSDKSGKLNSDLIPYLFDKNLVWTPWGKIFISDIVNKNNIRFDEHLHLGEDTIFCLEYLTHCTSVSVRHQKLYHYSGEWGGGSKYSLPIEERLYSLKRFWDLEHTLCEQYKFSSGLSIDKAKTVLLKARDTAPEMLQKINETIRSYWNRKYDRDSTGGLKWKIIFLSIRYHLDWCAEYFLRSV